jgi:hypothetical protein
MAKRGKVIPFPGQKAAPPESEPRGVDTRGLVEVHRCNQAEAVVIKSLFESDGIPTLLRSRFAHSVHPFTVGTQGEVIILVPERETMRCRVLLTRIARKRPTA